MPKPKLPLPKPKSFVAPQPSAQMPWAGQRGTMEDLGSFGVSPEDFFGGGGRIMFSDTAAKPALTPKQGSMNTQQQAYINGFVKRASEYGYSEAEAIELYKKAFSFADLGQRMGAGADRGMQNIGSALNQGKDMVMGAGKTLNQGAHNLAAGAGRKLQGVINNAGEGLRGFMNTAGQAGSALGQGFSGAGSALRQGVSGAGNALREGARGAVDSIGQGTEQAARTFYGPALQAAGYQRTPVGPGADSPMLNLPATNNTFGGNQTLGIAGAR